MINLGECSRYGQSKQENGIWRIGIQIENHLGIISNFISQNKSFLHLVFTNDTKSWSQRLPPYERKTGYQLKLTWQV